jgi:hypothetical protein
VITSNFIIKLILTPLIIGGTTLISRRWGERISGLIIGLPLTSAPVSIFFALEQGQAFAAGAARGAILGLIAVSVFCTAYVLSARRLRWYLAAAFSVLAYTIAIFGLSYATPALRWEIFVIPAVLISALLVLGKVEDQTRPLHPPWWDLLLRMVIATTLLILITSGAGALGPTWGGLLSPFPIFTFVMATFAHSQGGPAAAGRMIRGVLLGLFSYLAFFIVVAILVEHLSLALVYTLAAAAALAVNSLSLVYTVLKSRSAQPASIKTQDI